MTVNTTNITGFVVLPDDTIREKSSIIFRMTGFDTDGDDDAVVVPYPINAPIAVDGSIDIDLWPNPEGVRATLYQVSASIYNGVNPVTVNLGRISVPVSGGPYSLNDLLPIDPSSPANPSIQQMIDELRARDDQEEAARISADNSLSSRINTEQSARIAGDNTLDARIDNLSSGIFYAGTFDAAGGSFPAGSERGGTYRATSSGTVGGQAFDIGDRITAKVDGASTSVFAGNWDRASTSAELADIDAKIDNTIPYSSRVVASSAEVDADVTKISYIQNGVVVSFLRDDTSTVLETSDGKGWRPLPPYRLEHFGAVARFVNDGTSVPGNNSQVIQAAHDYVSGIGGGEVDLGVGTLPFNDTIYIGEGSPTLLKGHGRGVIANGITSLRATSATRLLYRGAAGGDGIILTSDRGNTGLAPRRAGGGIVDVTIDGNQSGGTGLSVISHNSHTIRVQLIYWTRRMFYSTCLSNGLSTGPSDNQFFRWNIHTADVNSTNEPSGGHVVINGEGIANTSLGCIEEIRVQSEDSSVGVHFGYCDALDIQALHSGTRRSGTGQGGRVYFHAYDTLPPLAGNPNGHARYNTIDHMQATQGVYSLDLVGSTGDTSGPNRINDLTRGNGAPLPFIQGGALLSYNSATTGEYMPAMRVGGGDTFSVYKKQAPFTCVIADAETGGNVSPTSLTATWSQIGDRVSIDVRGLNIVTTGMSGDLYFRWTDGPPLISAASFGQGAVKLQQISFTGMVSPNANALTKSFRLVENASASNPDFIEVADLTSGVSDILVSMSYNADP